jgi:hypothetical protein
VLWVPRQPPARNRAICSAIELPCGVRKLDLAGNRGVWGVTGLCTLRALYIHRALVDHRHARRYGHRMPGNEREAANMLAAYLERELGGAKAAG